MQTTVRTFFNNDPAAIDYATSFLPSVGIEAVRTERRGCRLDVIAIGRTARKAICSEQFFRAESRWFDRRA